MLGFDKNVMAEIFLTSYGREKRMTTVLSNQLNLKQYF